MWEKVSDHGNYSTLRMKVPGGWLVMTTYNRWDSAVVQTFVADLNHEWKLENKNKK